MTPQWVMSRAIMEKLCGGYFPELTVTMGIAVKAAIASLERAGYRIVPVEPTPEMIRAGERMDGSNYDDHNAEAIVHWRAMLAAYRPEGSGS